MPETQIEPRVLKRARIQLAEFQGGDGLVAPNGEPFDQLFVASTEAMASDAGVIYSDGRGPLGLGDGDGWRLDRFKLNPRFISSHDAHGPLTETALGSVVWLARRTDLPNPRGVLGGDRGLVAAVRFAKTTVGQETKTLYTAGDLDAVSVRWDWRTEDFRNPYEDEVEAYGERLKWVVEGADLIELSAVLFGADTLALALRSARARGVELPTMEAIASREARPAIIRTQTQEGDVEENPKPVDEPEIEEATRGDADEPVDEPEPADEPLEEAERDEPPADEAEPEGADEPVEDEPEPARDDVGGEDKSRIDPAALADGLDSARSALDGLDALMRKMQETRQMLGDALASIEALAVGDDMEIDADDGEDDEEDDEDSRDDVAEALVRFEGMLDDLRTMVAGMQDGAGDTRTQDDEEEFVEIDDDVAEALGLTTAAD